MQVMVSGVRLLLGPVRRRTVVLRSLGLMSRTRHTRSPWGVQRMAARSGHCQGAQPIIGMNIGHSQRQR
jgi:hypothetical protein